MMARRAFRSHCALSMSNYLAKAQAAIILAGLLLKASLLIRQLLNLIMFHLQATSLNRLTTCRFKEIISLRKYASQIVRHIFYLEASNFLNHISISSLLTAFC